MRVSIKYKLLLTILAAISLVVISIHLIGQWSFQRGFIRFVNSAEQARLERIASDLEGLYAEEGSWDVLRDHPRRWMSILQRTSDKRAPHPRDADRFIKHMIRDKQRRPPHDKPPRELKIFEARVVLFDSERNLLFGFPRMFPDFNYLSLKHNDRQIGRLGLAPQKELADSLQMQFVEEQKLTFGLIALGMVLLAGLLTLPITGRLIRPVKTLAAATRDLTRGNYKARTPVTSSDELGQLSKDFNVLADTLEQNKQARRQWVADISHELRTPLSVLRGEIEALQDKVREVTPGTLKTLHGEVLQLNRLVDDLYELSMSDLGALTYKKELIAPIDVIEKTIELFRHRIDDHHLGLDLDLSAGREVKLLADPERLQQLLANLFENSLRYTEAGGHIEIRSETNDQRLTVHFLDSAPGVPTSDLPHLFDRLYRVDASRNRAVGGAGLGLSICRNIVEAHGGKIEAQPSPHGGLWLVINLPLNG